MVSVEQVKLLENKVKQAIDIIKEIREENANLRRKYEESQGLNTNLKKEISELTDEKEMLSKDLQAFLGDSVAVEESVLNAISSLDDLNGAARSNVAPVAQPTPPVATSSQVNQTPTPVAVKPPVEKATSTPSPQPTPSPEVSTPPSLQSEDESDPFFSTGSQPLNESTSIGEKISDTLNDDDNFFDDSVDEEDDLDLF